MNQSRIFTALFLGIFARLPLQPILHATEPSVTIAQTALYPEKSELRMTAHSDILDGFILIKSPDRLPGFNPEIHSFGFAGNPLPGLAVFGGSISAQGLPARVRAPVFSLYTPFYSPVVANASPVLGTGETMSTRNAAVELTLRHTKVAALARLDESATEPSWVLVTQSIPAFDADDAALSVSLLAATRMQPPTADTDDSWFLPDPPLPGTRVYLPALEMLLEKGPLNGSCTGMLQLGQLLSPAGAVRADAAVSLPGLSVAGGFYRSDYRFADLDGTRNSILARSFAAPAFTFPVGKSGESELTWGGLLSNSTVRREKCFEKDVSVVAGGTGLQFRGRTTRMELHVMTKGDETECAGTASTGRIQHRRFQLELRAKALRTRLTDSIKTEHTVSGKLSVFPARWFTGSLAATGSRSTTHPGMDYSVSGACGFSLRQSRTDWDLSAKITRQNSGEPLSGSVYLKICLH